MYETYEVLIIAIVIGLIAFFGGAKRMLNIAYRTGFHAGVHHVLSSGTSKENATEGFRYRV